MRRGGEQAIGHPSPLTCFARSIFPPVTASRTPTNIERNSVFYSFGELFTLFWSSKAATSSAVCQNFKNGLEVEVEVIEVVDVGEVVEVVEIVEVDQICLVWFSLEESKSRIVTQSVSESAR